MPVPPPLVVVGRSQVFEMVAMMGNGMFTVAAQIMAAAVIVAAMLAFLGVGVLVFLHVLIVGRALRQGVSAMARGEGGGHGRAAAGGGLSVRELGQLPCFAFGAEAGKGRRGGGALDCAVCLESFQAGDRCRLLPACEHCFHAHCVDSWLKKTPLCPICRASARPRCKGGGCAAVEDGVAVGLPVSSQPSALDASS